MITTSLLFSFCVAFLCAAYIAFMNNKRKEKEDMMKVAAARIEYRDRHCSKHNYTVSPPGALLYCPQCTEENLKDPFFHKFSMTCMCPQCGEVDNHAWVNSTIYDEEIEGENLSKAELIVQLSAQGFGFTSLTTKDHLVAVWNNLHRPIASATEGTHAGIVVRECKKCSFSWKQS
jgi:hypothetical protein